MTIKNTTGASYEVLYDLEDEERIKKYPWTIPPSAKHKYPRTSLKGAKTCMLHRFLMNFPKKKVVDHIDENPLNNLKENLRICTHSENQRNRGKPKSNSSGYIGVSRYNDTRVSKFRAGIHIDGKEHSIGSFYTPLLAAVAYDEYIKEIDDKYSVLNFPKGLSPEQKSQIEKDRQEYQKLINERRKKHIEEHMQRNCDKYHDIFKKLENLIALNKPYNVRELCDMYVKNFNIKKPTARYLSKRVWMFYRGDFMNKNNYLALYKFVDTCKRKGRILRKKKLPPLKQLECISCKKILEANESNFYIGKNGRPTSCRCKKCISTANRLKYRQKKLQKLGRKK
jgi:hypothetical protein